MPELPLSNDTGIKPGNGLKSADDIANFISQDDDKELKIVDVEDEPEVLDLKKDKKTKEVDTEDEDDTEEDEDDDTDDDSDDDESDVDDKIEIDAPPKKKLILAKFPELFKEFPFLEKMLYRDREINTLFGGIDEAKEAYERLEELSGKEEVYNQIDSSLMEGRADGVLKILKDTDENAYNKYIDNYLTNLHAFDKDAYFDVTGNFVKQLVKGLHATGTRLGNEDILTAALELNKFIFNDDILKPATIRAKAEDKESEEAKKVKTEREAFVKERFDISRNDLQEKVDKKLRATIESYIDPRKTMPDYVRKNAIKDALVNLTESFSGDKQFERGLTKLWQKAFAENFSKPTLDAIESFYLGKARINLHPAIKKARAEALGGSKPPKVKAKADDVVDDEDDDKEEVKETPSRKRKDTTGKPPVRQDKRQRQKGESVADFFARD